MWGWYSGSRAPHKSSTRALFWVGGHLGPADFDRAFSDMTRARAGALAVLGSAIFNSERRRLVDLAAKHRLPTVYTSRDFVDAEGLMTYGPNLADLFRRAGLTIPRSLLLRADQVIE